VDHGLDVVAYDEGCYHVWEATHYKIREVPKLEAGIVGQVLQNIPLLRPSKENRWVPYRINIYGQTNCLVRAV
jgi:hypothetical protein